MNTKSKIALIGLGVAVGLGLGVTGYVSAADTTDSKFPPMVQGLVEKFNLNEAEVTTYLETEREERRTEREATLTSALEKLVAEGKLTEEQKAAFLAKHDELQAKREALRGTTGTDKRDQMQAFKAEMGSFLEAQGIDKDILPQLGQNGAGGRGQGRGMHRNNQ